MLPPGLSHDGINNIAEVQHQTVNMVPQHHEQPAVVVPPAPEIPPLESEFCALCESFEAQLQALEGDELHAKTVFCPASQFPEELTVVTMLKRLRDLDVITFSMPLIKRLFNTPHPDDELALKPGTMEGAHTNTLRILQTLKKVLKNDAVAAVKELHTLLRENKQPEAAKCIRQDLEMFRMRFLSRVQNREFSQMREWLRQILEPLPLQKLAKEVARHELQELLNNNPDVKTVWDLSMALPDNPKSKQFMLGVRKKVLDTTQRATMKLFHQLCVGKDGGKQRETLQLLRGDTSFACPSTSLSASGVNYQVFNNQSAGTSTSSTSPAGTGGITPIGGGPTPSSAQDIAKQFLLGSNAMFASVGTNLQLPAGTGSSNTATSSSSTTMPSQQQDSMDRSYSEKEWADWLRTGLSGGQTNTAPPPTSLNIDNLFPQQVPPPQQAPVNMTDRMVGFAVPEQQVVIASSSSSSTGGAAAAARSPADLAALAFPPGVLSSGSEGGSRKMLNKMKPPAGAGTSSVGQLAFPNMGAKKTKSKSAKQAAGAGSTSSLQTGRGKKAFDGGEFDDNVDDTEESSNADQDYDPLQEQPEGDLAEVFKLKKEKEKLKKKQEDLDKEQDNVLKDIQDGFIDREEGKKRTKKIQQEENEVEEMLKIVDQKIQEAKDRATGTDVAAAEDTDHKDKNTQALPVKERRPKNAAAASSNATASGGGRQGGRTPAGGAENNTTAGPSSSKADPKEVELLQGLLEVKQKSNLISYSALEPVTGGPIFDPVQTRATNQEETRRSSASSSSGNLYDAFRSAEDVDAGAQHREDNNLARASHVVSAALSRYGEAIQEEREYAEGYAEHEQLEAPPLTMPEPPGLLMKNDEPERNTRTSTGVLPVPIPGTNGNRQPTPSNAGGDGSTTPGVGEERSLIRNASSLTISEDGQLFDSRNAPSFPGPSYEDAVRRALPKQYSATLRKAAVRPSGGGVGPTMQLAREKFTELDWQACWELVTQLQKEGQNPVSRSLHAVTAQVMKQSIETPARPDVYDAGRGQAYYAYLSRVVQNSALGQDPIKAHVKKRHEGYAQFCRGPFSAFFQVLPAPPGHGDNQALLVLKTPFPGRATAGPLRPPTPKASSAGPRFPPSQMIAQQREQEMRAALLAENEHHGTGAAQQRTTRMLIVPGHVAPSPAAAAQQQEDVEFPPRQHRANPSNPFTSDQDPPPRQHTFGDVDGQPVVEERPEPEHEEELGMQNAVAGSSQHGAPSVAGSPPAQLHLNAPFGCATAMTPSGSTTAMDPSQQLLLQQQQQQAAFAGFSQNAASNPFTFDPTSQVANAAASSTTDPLIQAAIQQQMIQQAQVNAYNLQVIQQYQAQAQIQAQIAYNAQKQVELMQQLRARDSGSGSERVSREGDEGVPPPPPPPPE
ncbi:unnamed protein product [Amoebophrya sp. A120]|nr:unnamed protein product [Amoebophrya sp. A120]|eukprot:GSA120T00001805001.1